MLTTVDPIEAGIVLTALAALMVSAVLCWRSLRNYRDARAVGACEAVLTLGWMRFRNEAGRVAITLGVLYAGWVNAMTATPTTPSENYWIFRGIWLAIALICLSKSLLNARDSRAVVLIIERERAAGRMQGNAEGRVAERKRADEAREAVGD